MTMSLWLFVAVCLPLQAHTFVVSSGTFTVGGLVAGGSQEAVIYYPDSAPAHSKFPLLSFGHGYEAGGTALQPYYHKLLQDISSAGFVVVAAASCPSDFCTKPMSADMSHVLDACAKNTSAHPALALVNQTAQQGIFGHSMGAFCVTRAAVDAQANGRLGAAVYLHGGNFWPWGGASEVKVPVFSTTGSNDTTAPPAGTKLAWNEQSHAHPRVFANLLGALHNESITSGRLNPFVAAFFQCHLTQLQGACSMIYGNSSDSLCHSANPSLAMKECLVHA